MTIKTNMSKINDKHDNVNYEPVEKQIFNFIVQTNKFKKVEYKTRQGFMGYLLDDEIVLNFRFDKYEFVFAFHGDEFNFLKENSTFDGFRFSGSFNVDINNELNNYLEKVLFSIQKTKEAKKITKEIMENQKEISKQIEKELEDFFSNDLIKPTYGICESNLIPRITTENKEVWSWLSFSIKGTKQLHSKHEKTVGIELYMDGKIKNKRIDEFLKAIQCEDDKCQPSIKDMQKKISLISDLEEKLNFFNAKKIPTLNKFLSVQKKGYNFRKNLNHIN